MDNKDEILVEYLRSCPAIAESKFYFNLGDIEDGALQIMTDYNDVALHTPYIDGSVLKRYTWMMDYFKAAAYNPVIPNKPDENISDLADGQDIIDWLIEKAELGEFPDFGDNVLVDEMRVITTKPNLMGVDDTISPPMAIYRISVEIDYIDYTKRIWN